MTEPLPDPSLLLVRYGELSLKGGNRRQFEGMLANNLYSQLEPLGGGKVNRPWGRILVRPAGRWRDALGAVQKTFGIKSVSPAWTVPTDLDAIVALGRQMLADQLAGWTGPGKPRYRVRVRRAEKEFPMTSAEAAAVIADRVLDDDAPVTIDLKQADLELGIEIRPEGSYVYGQRFPGPGGLPVGTLGKGICLLSGGIDSPVAAWSAMKRGLKVLFASFHSPPYLGEGSKAKIEDLVRTLAAWQGPSRLFSVPFTEVQLAIREGAPERLRTVLYRRSMARISSSLARRSGAGALITGESLGQVASQTLENLASIEAAADFPILRPLITADKEETIALAKAINTLTISNRPEPDCCTVFQPRTPELRSRAEDCAAIEARLDLLPLEDSALRAAEEQRITS